MKVLIIYDSKYGTTKRAAEILANMIENSKVINIDAFEETDKNYDVIILGTRVYQNKVSVKMLEFVQAHVDWLKTKLVFAYVMMLEGDSGPKYLKPIKDILGDSLISMKSFGGKLILEKLDDMDYKAIKKQLDEMGIPLKNIDMMNEEEIKKHGQEINEKINQPRESRLDDELIIALAETYLRQHRLCIIAGHEAGHIWQKQFDYVYDNYRLYLIAHPENAMHVNWKPCHVSMLIFSPQELTLPKSNMQIKGQLTMLSQTEKAYQKILFLCGGSQHLNSKNPFVIYQVSLIEIELTYPGFLEYGLEATQVISYQ